MAIEALPLSVMTMSWPQRYKRCEHANLWLQLSLLSSVFPLISFNLVFLFPFLKTGEFTLLKQGMVRRIFGEHPSLTT